MQHQVVVSEVAKAEIDKKTVPKGERCNSSLWPMVLWRNSNLMLVGHRTYTVLENMEQVGIMPRKYLLSPPEEPPLRSAAYPCQRAG